MKSVISIIYILLIISCHEDQKHKLITASRPIVLLEKQELENRQLQNQHIYIYENDTIYQKAELNYLAKDKVKFKLISIRKKNAQESKIEGIALSKSEDPEIDEDEEGNAYPARQYIFEGDCWLSFRIDMEEGTRLQIKEGDCKSHRYKKLFNSIGVLRRVN